MEEFAKDLLERNQWLIRLRWLAILGVNIAIFLVTRIFKLPLPILVFYVITAFLAVYNLILTRILILARIKEKNSFAVINRIANTQISLDLLSLAGLIHFSGGIENPFIFYFIFHMIIASTLLSRRASFLQATFATGLFFLMVVLEYFGVIRHYSLSGFIVSGLYNHRLYVAGTSFVFISTVYIAVYMATSISLRLRAQEKSLRNANALLLKKDQIKSEYVLRVTHDIKEHLAAIQGCIEPVIGRITGSLNDEQMSLLERANERVAKLTLFVKALLEITRIKLSKGIKMENFSFREMLLDAANLISLKTKDKNIALKIAIDDSVNSIHGAKEYIQEAIVNLLANSVKYTPDNGKVEILVFDQGNNILIKIKDTGIGIPHGEIANIFNEFYRASNAQAIERSGTGLGLSIAKQIVERHKGKIWIESVEGKGTTVSIILPK